jgi:hypothetical protein
MQLHTIRYAAQQGLESVELLGDEPWMAGWTDTVRPCVGLRVYPVPSAFGRLAADGGCALRRRLGRAPAAPP